MSDVETLGINFDASVTGIGMVADLSSVVGGLYNKALTADFGFSRLASTVVNASNIIAGSAFFGGPALFLSETIRHGSNLEKELTNLTVAYKGNRDSAVSAFRDVAEAVDFLPVTTGQALSAFTELKLSGVDALKSFKKETRNVGGEMLTVSDNMLSMISDIAAFRKTDFSNISFGMMRALQGQAVFLSHALGPGGEAVAKAMASKSEAAFKGLFEFIQKKGIRGLALEQSLTFSAFVTGIQDMYQRFFFEISGLLDAQGGVFRRLKDAVANAYMQLQLWFRDQEKVRRLAKALVDAFEPLIDFLARFAKDGMKKFIGFLDMLGNHPMLVKVGLYTTLTMGFANAFQTLLRVFDFFFGGMFSKMNKWIQTISMVLGSLAMLRWGIMLVTGSLGGMISAFIKTKWGISIAIKEVDILTYAYKGLNAAITMVRANWGKLGSAIMGSGIIRWLGELILGQTAFTRLLLGGWSGGWAFFKVLLSGFATVASAIGLVIAGMLILRGMWDTVNTGAFMVGFREGIADVKHFFELIPEYYGLIGKTMAQIFPYFAGFNEKLAQIREFFVLSQGQADMWKDIGYAIGIVAAVVGGALYAAVKVVYTVFRAIYDVVMGIARALVFAGGLIGMAPSFATAAVAGDASQPYNGAFARTTDWRPGSVNPAAPPPASMNPASQAGGSRSSSLSISIGQIVVPEGTTAEQTQHIVKEASKALAAGSNGAAASEREFF